MNEKILNTSHSQVKTVKYKDRDYKVQSDKNRKKINKQSPFDTSRLINKIKTILEMMSDIINLNDSYRNWENDFSEQNLIGIKEPDTESDILAKTKAYEYAFYSYGLLPLLLLLDEYIELERYYECYCIKTAIDNINFKYKQNLETVYGKKAVDSVKEYYDRQKKDFSEYLQRVPFYVREVFQFVNKKINPIT